MLRKFAKNCQRVMTYDLQRMLGVGPVFCRGVHILMYHGIRPERDELGLAISPEFFEAQIRFLQKNFNILSLDTALEKKSDGMKEPLFVITFDDGYRDNFTNAYPILRRYGVPATIFVTCDDIDRGVTDWHRMDSAIRGTTIAELDLESFGLGVIPLETLNDRSKAISKLHRMLKQVENSRRLEILPAILERCAAVELDRIMLTWEEVRLMAGEGLITIGSHSLSHPILTRVTPDRARQEIEGSRIRIEQMIGRPVKHFAYPNGNFDVMTSDMVRQSGYRSACTTLPGCNENNTDPFALRRIDITYGMCESVTGQFSRRMFAMGMATEAAAKEDFPPQNIKPATGA